MQRLPILEADGRCWRLPLADRSAIVLADALLAPGDDRLPTTVDALAAALRRDPPLLLWTICRGASQWPQAAPSLQGVAQGLASHLRGLTDDAFSPDDPFGEASDDVALGLVARSLSVPPSADADPFGILHNAAEWLRWASDSASATTELPPLVPPWLRTVLFEQKPPAAGEPDLSWWQPLPEAAGLLHRAVQVSARLRNLEHRFQETLEREKLEAMAELAAGAGHEMNNPLAVISGRAQLLLRGEHDPERRRELALVNGQAMRVHEMIADLMLFARPPLPRPEMCDLANLLQSLVEEISPGATAQQTQVALQLPREPVSLRVDPVQCRVALKAACDNALEALGHGGSVRLSARRVTSPHDDQAGDAVQITIADDGPGFGPEVRRHLFDPFFSGRGAGRGLGMGLAKCWRIVTAHGGQVHVDSTPQQGTTLHITLPLAADKVSVEGESP